MGVNADTFMPIFSADTWHLSNRYIPRRGNNTFFLVSSRTDLAINFDLVKCITKIDINSYPNYNGNVEGELSPERYLKYRHQQDVLPYCIQETVK